MCLPLPISPLDMNPQERYEALCIHEKYPKEKTVPDDLLDRWEAGKQLNNDPTIRAYQLRMNIGKVAILLLSIIGLILGAISGATYATEYLEAGQGLAIAAGVTAGVGLIIGTPFALYWKKRLKKELFSYDEKRDWSVAHRTLTRCMGHWKNKDVQIYLAKNPEITKPCGDQSECRICQVHSALQRSRQQ